MRVVAVSERRTQILKPRSQCFAILSRLWLGIVLFKLINMIGGFCHGSLVGHLFLHEV